METKNKNALSVGLCLSLVIVLLFNVYAVANQEANAMQWTTLLQSAVSIHPNGSVLDGNGNIDVETGTGANVLQFSGTSPYPLNRNVNVGLGCTQMNRGQWVDSVNSKLWVSCGAGGQIVEMDLNSLGVLNSTSPGATCCNALFMIGSQLYAEGSGGTIWTYFISGNNIIKCGVNPGQCSNTFSNTINACAGTGGLYPDFTHNVAYMDCNNPSASIWVVGLPVLLDIRHWNKAGACIASCSTIQNTLAFDGVNNFIWSSEAGSTLQAYNSTGSAIRSITVAGATSGLQNPQIVGNFIYFEDLTRAFEFQYGTNGTALNSASFANVVITPVTSASSFSVGSNGVAVIGAEANAGSSTIFLGGITTGNIPSGGGGGGGGGNGCPSTTTNCGDVNCNLPQNKAILLCTTGGGAVQNGGFFVTTAVNSLLTGSGLINSTNTNVKTNGTGYILVMVAFGVLTAMFWLASGGDLGRIPTFVWFIASLGVLGMAVGIGLIDVTFFIIGAIAVIALATARILSTLELGGFR